MLLPSDATREEIALVQLVKINMLKRLKDRERFIFIFCFEMGHSQADAAEVLGIHETNIRRRIQRIRKTLTPFKKSV